MKTETGTVAFDVVGTLFSLEGLRDELVGLGAPPQALELWFAESLRDFVGLSHAGGYAPLAQFLAASLKRAVLPFGVEFSDSDVERAMGAIRGLEAAEGAEEACRSLTQAGWTVLALTNGSEDMTNHLLERAGIRNNFEAVLSCDSIGTSKPHPDVYDMAKKHATGELWMVAAHAWDVAGAARAGLKTVWISAKEKEYQSIYPEPDAVATDLAEAAEKILSRP